MKPVVVLMALVLAGGTAMGQPSSNRPMMGRGSQGEMGGHMAMMQKLNLTDEQQAQIRKLHVDFQKKEIQNEAKIRLARLDLSQMMLLDKPDRAAIEKTIREIGSIQTDTKLARVDQMLAVRNLLTPEQLKTMKQNMMNRMGTMRKRVQIYRRGGSGMLGESYADPENGDMLGMATAPDPMNAPQASDDDLDMEEVITE
jgi:Spy/CpxP family protein refolding chaperone